MGLVFPSQDIQTSILKHLSHNPGVTIQRLKKSYLQPSWPYHLLTDIGIAKDRGIASRELRLTPINSWGVVLLTLTLDIIRKI